MANDATTNDILEAINEFSVRIDSRMDKIDSRMDKIDSQMVTKDYLDTKMFDLRGDIISVIRKEDNKLLKLVEILKEKNVITTEDEKKIIAMEPFPQMTL